MIDFKEAYVQSGNVAPLNSFPWIAAMGKPTLEVFGGKLTPLCAFYKNNYAYIYYEKGNFDDLAEKALAKISKGNSIYDTWKRKTQELKQLSRGADEAPDQDDARGFKRVFNKMVEYWKYSVFIDAFDTGTDFREIEKIAQQHKLTKGEVQTLTTPAELSYLQEFEKTLLEASTDDDSKKIVGDFFWINTNYTSWAWFGAMEAKKAAIERKMQAKWRETLAALQQYTGRINEKQEEILKSKNLDENPLALFKKLVAWRDERKKFNYIGLHALGLYTRRLLENKNMPLHLYTVLTPAECIEEKLPSVKELETRVSTGMLIVGLDDGFEVVSGEEAVKAAQALKAKRVGNGFDLRGQSACLGRATAKVIVIENAAELGKFEEGCILVTGMTRPEFVPAMKKSAGIITDEGGVTCHAAIVSRELGKPCIVGTQVATKWLKTGDVVELDAFHGLVKKVS